MKLISLTWRDPGDSLVTENFEADKVKVHTEQGWLKLNGPDGLLRIFPADKICLVQFVEKEEPARILRPSAVPAEFQPS